MGDAATRPRAANVAGVTVTKLLRKEMPSEPKMDQRAAIVSDRDHGGGMPEMPCAGVVEMAMSNDSITTSPDMGVSIKMDEATSAAASPSSVNATSLLRWEAANGSSPSHMNAAMGGVRSTKRGRREARSGPKPRKKKNARGAAKATKLRRWQAPSGPGPGALVERRALLTKRWGGRRRRRLFKAIARVAKRVVRRVKRVVKKVVRKIKKFVRRVIKTMVKIGRMMVTAWNKIRKQVKKTVKHIGRQCKKAVKEAKKLLRKVGKFVSKAVHKLGKGVRKLGMLVVGLAKKAWNFIKKFLDCFSPKKILCYLVLPACDCMKGNLLRKERRKQAKEGEQRKGEERHIERKRRKGEERRQREKGNRKERQREQRKGRKKQGQRKGT